MTLMNMRSESMVDKVVKTFAEYVIYSSGDLYSSYEQFQLAEESRNLIIMKILLDLFQMCTLLQGVINSMAYIQNIMNQILKEFVLEKTNVYIFWMMF